MKPDIHPEYRDVLFHDTSSDTYFVVGSTVQTSETKEHEGQTYQKMRREREREAHKGDTGKQKGDKSDGRVARFNKRFGGRSLKN